MDNNCDENNVDPLALDSEIEYDVNSCIEPEILIEDNAPLRRSKRCGKKQQGKQQSNNKPNAEQVWPLFPITSAMRQRIRRMKKRMLATLKISENQLTDRCKRRAKQTRESRQRAASADAPSAQETDKKMAITKIQQEMETPEQLAAQRANKRAEGRRYVAKRNRTETTVRVSPSIRQEEQTH